jgi:hypothetical protein
MCRKSFKINRALQAAEKLNSSEKESLQGLKPG